MRIDSDCHQCAKPLTIEVDEKLHWRVLSSGAQPLLFEPDIDWAIFRRQNIIHDY